MDTEKKQAIEEFNRLVEESHKRWGSLYLSETECVILLTNLAAINSMARVNGLQDPLIEAVEDYMWWDICNALSRQNRVEMQAAMKEAGIPLPPHPGDIV